MLVWGWSLSSCPPPLLRIFFWLSGTSFLALHCKHCLALHCTIFLALNCTAGNRSIWVIIMESTRTFRIHMAPRFLPNRLGDYFGKIELRLHSVQDSIVPTLARWLKKTFEAKKTYHDIAKLWYWDQRPTAFAFPPQSLSLSCFPALLFSHPLLLSTFLPLFSSKLDSTSPSSSAGCGTPRFHSILLPGDQETCQGRRCRCWNWRRSRWWRRGRCSRCPPPPVASPSPRLSPAPSPLARSATPTPRTSSRMWTNSCLAIWTCDWNIFSHHFQLSFFLLFLILLQRTRKFGKSSHTGDTQIHMWGSNLGKRVNISITS